MKKGLFVLFFFVTCNSENKNIKNLDDLGNKLESYFKERNIHSIQRKFNMDDLVSISLSKTGVNKTKSRHYSIAQSLVNHLIKELASRVNKSGHNLRFVCSKVTDQFQYLYFWYSKSYDKFDVIEISLNKNSDIIDVFSFRSGMAFSDEISEYLYNNALLLDQHRLFLDYKIEARHYFNNSHYDSLKSILQIIPAEVRSNSLNELRLELAKVSGTFKEVLDSLDFNNFGGSKFSTFHQLKFALEQKRCADIDTLYLKLESRICPGLNIDPGVLACL